MAAASSSRERTRNCFRQEVSTRRSGRINRAVSVATRWRTMRSPAQPARFRSAVLTSLQASSSKRVADETMLTAYLVKRLRRRDVIKTRHGIAADAEPWQRSRQAVPHALDLERFLEMAVQHERHGNLANQRQARVAHVSCLEAHAFERCDALGEALRIGATVSHDRGERFRRIHGVITTVLTQFAGVPAVLL